jgi:hypothetical protein
LALQIADLYLIEVFGLFLAIGITCIILRVMYRATPSKSMQSPDQAPSVDIGFVSLTRTLVDSEEPKNHCPECDAEIDFKGELEWTGPSAFLCKACEQVVELHRLENL